MADVQNGEKNAEVANKGEEAIKVLEDLRSATFFKNIQAQDSKRPKGSIKEDEKNMVFNLFASSRPAEDKHTELLGHDIDLDTVEQNRVPKVNRWIKIIFHVFVVSNLLITLSTSYEFIIQEANTYALLTTRDYNCLDHYSTGNVLRYFVEIIHGGFCVVLLFTRFRRASEILIAFIFVQAMNTSLDMIVIVFRARFSTVSTFSSGNSLIVGVIWEVITVIVGIMCVLMAMQRYYDLAIPVKLRERRLRAESYGNRFLNDQIVYKNAPSFLQRKYVLRMATAFQIYSVLRTIIEESSTRHKRGQKLKFDPIFTQQHIQHAKHDETLIEQLSEETIMKIIRGRSARRIHELEADRAKRRQSLLEKNIATLKKGAVVNTALSTAYVPSTVEPVPPSNSNSKSKSNLPPPESKSDITMV